VLEPQGSHPRHMCLVPHAVVPSRSADGDRTAAGTCSGGAALAAGPSVPRTSRRTRQGGPGGVRIGPVDAGGAHPVLRNLQAGSEMQVAATVADVLVVRQGEEAAGPDRRQFGMPVAASVSSNSRYVIPRQACSPRNVRAGALHAAFCATTRAAGSADPGQSWRRSSVSAHRRAPRARVPMTHSFEISQALVELAIAPPTVVSHGNT